MNDSLHRYNESVRQKMYTDRLRLIFLWRSFWAAVILGGIALLGSCDPAQAHPLKPGECTAYASDAVRFLALKNQGWSEEDALEGLRKMFLDQGWFVYVQDKEDVQREKLMIGVVWKLDEDASPADLRNNILNNCDPDNDEQFRLLGSPLEHFGT